MGASTTLRECAAVIFAAAQAPAIQEVYVDGKGIRKKHWPLRAARHLLALGNYPHDVHANVEDLGWSIHKLCTEGDKIVNQQPLTSPSLRHRMATIAGDYGSSRNITVHEPRIAKSLLKAIDGVLQSEDRNSLIAAVLLQMAEAERQTEIHENTDVLADSIENNEVVEQASVVPHLASTFEDPMGLPRLLAPQGETYRRWALGDEARSNAFDPPYYWISPDAPPRPESFMKRIEEDRRLAFVNYKRREYLNPDFWSDRTPLPEELFLVHEASEGPVGNLMLYMDATIRLVVERFDKTECWNTPSGPLPLLDAIQAKMEEMLESERKSMPRAISLAQAVFLGRLILDPRTQKSRDSRRLQNRPEVRHFPHIDEGWSESDILQNYRRWIVDVAYELPLNEVDWSRNHYGVSREVFHFDSFLLLGDARAYAALRSDLLRLADHTLSLLGRVDQGFPALQSMMYMTGYDIMLKDSYIEYVKDLADRLEDYPGHTEWLLGFFSYPRYVGKLHSWFKPRRVFWKRLFGRATPAERGALFSVRAARLLERKSARVPDPLNSVISMALSGKLLPWV
jgi:hypothetical protein